MTLVSAMGKKVSSEKAQDTWLQDVSVQATWKDDLSIITKDSKKCLNSFKTAGSGKEIDLLFEKLLFTDTGDTTQQPKGGQAGTHTVNGHVHMNGHTKQHVVLASGSDTNKLRSFDSTQTDVSLSMLWVSSLLHIIFSDTNSPRDSKDLPEATLDYLLKKGLVSSSTLAHAKLNIDDLLKHHPRLRMRFISDVVGFLPLNLLLVLKSFLQDAAQLPRALSAVMIKLDNFDDSLVTSAIRSYLEQSEMEILLHTFQQELLRRLSLETDNVEPVRALSVSDEVLCVTITRILDSISLSNLVLTRETSALIHALRPAVAQLIAQVQIMASTSTCILELLMKARLLETTFKSSSKMVADGHLQNQADKENPQPEPRRREMPLDRVKRVEKNQTQRAKAYARVQGIGSVYTIETLKI